MRYAIRGVAVAGVASLALALLASCTSRVEGRIAYSPASTTSAPGAPPHPTGPAPTATSPGGAGTPSPARSSTSPTPTSDESAAASPPASCPAGRCPQLSHSAVKDGYQIVLRSGSAGQPGPMTAVIELVRDGVPAQWRTEADEYQPHLACSTKTPDLHCVLMADVGAHGSQAQLYLVVNGAFVLPAPVATDTPGIHAQDLDGDGDLDLQVPVNDYQPDYADGGTYWQTWLLKDRAYSLSGCTATVHDQMPAMPTAPVHGACPAQ